MLPATPILPEQGSRPNLERMQQQADPARLRRGVAMPLTLLAQGTRSTLAHLCRVDQAQAAISLMALVGCMKRCPAKEEISTTEQCPRADGTHRMSQYAY